MNLTRAGLTAGLIAAGLALAACSSSGGNSGGTGGNSTANSSSDTSTSASGGGSSTCAPGSLTSDGSTAQQNAINAWIQKYTAQCSGANVTYSGGGSGQGVTDFTAGKVDFAGSDAALDPTKGEVAAANKRCGTGSQALDIPMVTGPVAVAYNVKGVSNGAVTFTPDVLTKVFTGKIKTWNDPAIAAINKGVNLPSEPITVFFRSDQSGTTSNFEKYLNTTDPTGYPTTPSKTWVGAGQGKTGSQGVQQAIKTTEGGIGYIEWSYAGSAGLSMAKIDNGGGAVALTAETAGKAVAAAKLASNGGNDLTLKLDYATKTPGAYPIILVTYEIVCSKYSDASVGTRVKAFLTYTSSSAGQQQLPTVGSAPLPTSILGKVQHVVSTIS
ncbi:MAG TPA: phosphate ABC transporter substrate-binding protein PstS [Jatrophihabitans sp.]|nr:phosphate ABC transporter substrate-binding protein PstS [Jatrophihabitans sp.]